MGKVLETAIEYYVRNPLKEVNTMRWLTGSLFLILAALCSTDTIAQERYIELQIVSRAGGELGVQHELMQMLAEVGADRVTTKSTTGNARTNVVESESNGTTHILVTGILDGRTLKLPGGRYSLRDEDRIKDYIQKLRDDGAEVTLADKQAFGLTGPQLVSVFEELGSAVQIETKGQPTNQVIQELAAGVRSEIDITRRARRMLDKTPVVEEFRGLSTGTAMAGMLRPLGLVVTPYREQGRAIRFRISASTEADEHWPVGWPIEEAPIKAEPKVFERLDDVSIQNFSLQDTLDAIEARVGVPFLYDQNGIARAGVELSDVKVTLVRKRMQYFLVLEKILAQSRPRLTVEIRKDENGKSFLWISPLSPTR